MYKVVVERSAQKQLSKIAPAFIPAIKKAIIDLGNNPRPHGYKKLKGVDACRIRVGDYRIVYEIHEKIITVVVVDVGHRKNIYNRF